MGFASPPIRSSVAERAEKVARLVYRLVDAHCDTEQLVRNDGTELDRGAHLDHVRNLERATREILAERVETSARYGQSYDLLA